MMKDKENVAQLWSSLKTERQKYESVWRDISRYTGINVDTNTMQTGGQGSKAAQLDEFVDDPTSAISVNQAGDYLIGIMWGTGDEAFNILPSEQVLEIAQPEEVKEWYDFATKRVLYHMNHSEAGLNAALKPYAYDQFSFGTSGIGAFPNKGFAAGVDDNVITFRGYGVDNTCIDEGKSGLVEYVFSVYNWRVNRIVGEFCMDKGVLDRAKLGKMPKRIQDAHGKNDFNQLFNIVFGVFPRADFDPKLKGRRGTRYRGVWFMDGENDNSIFHEEDFAERPIAMGRQVKVRGEVYGRSSGTLLLSSIRAVNFMTSTVIEILEKMANPSLGMFNNAIFGDSVLDTSASGLTVFNSALMGTNGPPLFPIHDVGDPAPIIQFLIPYLNEKISTAFKVDALLDFNSAKDMTATESLQRYAIRGKSLAGMLQQQKSELAEPLTKRSISLVYNAGELGIDPTTHAAQAKALQRAGKANRVIPPQVLEVMKSGKPWYTLKFNNELEKLTRTEAVQNLLQILNSIGGIAAMYPDIIEAVDWYQMLKNINDNLGANNQILISAEDFKKALAQKAKTQQAAMALQAGQAAGQIQKDTAQANKSNREAAFVGQ